MSDGPLISVVTVVYNGVRFLSETIESVLAQEGVNLEYWVIDGGSGDGTVEIIQRHSAGLTGWISESDQGISHAFNKGVERSRGTYVMLLNADDALAHRHSLAELLRHASDSQWPDVIYGDCDLHDPDSGAFLYRAVVEYQRERFLRGRALPHPGMLMHQRYFERYGRFDLSFKVAMDYELFLRGIPSVGAVRAPVLVSRVRAGGISARNRALAADETIRALRMHGHLGRAGEWRMRAAYVARAAVRRGLERAGLYSFFDSWRRRRSGQVGWLN